MKTEETNYFRCYFSNDMYKVGNVLTEKEFNRVPTIFKGDFKPYKQLFFYSFTAKINPLNKKYYENCI